jgi:hypothetical protein
MIRQPSAPEPKSRVRGDQPVAISTPVGKLELGVAKQIRCNSFIPFAVEPTVKVKNTTMDENSDGLIVVLGVTGAGKSYFINCLKSGAAKEGKQLHSGE